MKKYAAILLASLVILAMSGSIVLANSSLASKPAIILPPNTTRINLLPRDHTEISCGSPLLIGLKAVTTARFIVYFQVFNGTSAQLLWTSPTTFLISAPWKDFILVTSITNPPPLIRVEMHQNKTGFLLNQIYLEPDCRGGTGVTNIVTHDTVIFPPPNNCKMVINPDPRSGFPMFPTVTVAVPSAQIGHTASAQVLYQPPSGPSVTLAQGTTTIDTEMIQLSLTGSNPMPVGGTGPSPNSFFDVFFEISVDSIPVSTTQCTILNGQILENMMLQFNGGH